MSLGIDRRFFDIRLSVAGVENDVPTGVTPYAGLQYIVGDTPAGAFASFQKNDIAIYNGTEWGRIIPKGYHLEVLDVSANAVKRYDEATIAWVVVKEFLSETDLATDVHEVHVLTAAEATAKKFNLANAIDDTLLSQVFLSVGGVDQVPTVDFEAVNEDVDDVEVGAIQWTGKDLAQIDLAAGDTFFVVYKKKIAAGE